MNLVLNLRDDFVLTVRVVQKEFIFHALVEGMRQLQVVVHADQVRFAPGRQILNEICVLMFAQNSFKVNLKSLTSLKQYVPNDRVSNSNPAPVKKSSFSLEIFNFSSSWYLQGNLLNNIIIPSKWQKSEMHSICIVNNVCIIKDIFYK